VGPYQSQGASIGSNGYPGFSPIQAGSWDRANWAAYFDAEADITDKLLLGLAIRHEDFDDFGRTTNYKAAIRYWFSDSFSLRSSVSTGFRAPTPGQLFSTRTQTIGFNNELVQGGRIPPTNPVSAFYGALPLEPEESENLSAGFTWQPFDSFLITADYFRINVENGMGVSPNFGVTPEDVQELINLGVPGASDFLFINFFVNGLETRRDGIDVVATYSLDWERAGSSSLSFAWNRTEVDVKSMEFPNRNFAVNLEGRPKNRSILTFNHTVNDFRFLVRASFYGDWVEAGFGGNNLDDLSVICASRADSPPSPPGTDECYGDTWMVDVEAAYTFADRYTLIVGADNVFDEYPEEDYDYPDFSFGVQYPRSSPIGYNGGFWYVRLRAEF
jgi:iron complex outermembrane receptor protein